MKYKIYIYGGGNRYNALSAYLSAYDSLIDIEGIVTTKKQPYAYIDGIKCITVDEINAEAVDYIIIAANAWYEIMNILRNKGVSEKKIIRAEVFQLPNFHFESYLKVKNESFSILSNNCLAGVIYKELGLKSLTPTINMNCFGMDYIEFLSNYEYYCSQEIRAYTTKEYIENPNLYHNFVPRGIINDKITFYFTHYKNEDEGIAVWKKGTEQMNCQNVVALAALQSDEEAYAFDKLPIKRKLGFYYKNLGLDNVVYVDEWNDLNKRYHHAGDWSAFVVHYFSNSFEYISHINWIKFLCGQKDYLRFQRRNEDSI